MTLKKKIEKLVNSENSEAGIKIEMLEKKIKEYENLTKGLKEQIERLERLQRQMQNDGNLWQVKWEAAEQEMNLLRAEKETLKTKLVQSENTSSTLKREFEIMRERNLIRRLLKFLHIRQ